MAARKFFDRYVRNGILAKAKKHIGGLVAGAAIAIGGVETGVVEVVKGVGGKALSASHSHPHQHESTPETVTISTVSDSKQLSGNDRQYIADQIAYYTQKYCK